jgi:foldase protein PrsA
MAKKNFKKRVLDFKKNFQKFSKRKDVKVGVVIVVLLSLLYLLKGLFVVAFVNGQPISRLSVVRELERRGGSQALDSLINQTLILQEAKKQNVTVTDEEVNATIAEIEASLEGQGELDQILISEGMTKDDLINQVRLQKLAEKILSDKVSVSDEEVRQYFETNADLLPEDISSEELNNKVKNQLQQQKLSEAIQIWLTDLKDKANINYFVDY